MKTPGLGTPNRLRNDDRPNVIVFMADQLRADALGCYGNKTIKTPNLDALAKTGTLFANAYTTQPLCVPARCSMLSGIYPSEHGSMSNEVTLDPSLRLYPELLRQSGYQTFASGKIHINPLSRFAPGKPPEAQTKQDLDEPGEMPDRFPYYGFEKVEFVEGYRSQYLKQIKKERPDLVHQANHYPPAGHDGSQPWQTYASSVPLSLHRSTWTASRAIQLLKTRDRTRPFLLHCSFFDPHHPFDPCPPYDKAYDPNEMPLPIPATENEINALPGHHKSFMGEDRGSDGKRFCEHTPGDLQKMTAHYYGMISLIDDSVGAVLEYCKSQNLMENTAIIFVADHGELLGDHGLISKGAFHYQGLIKVPLIFSFLKKYGAGKNSDALCLNYDIAPTILDLAGIAPKQMSAKSLLPILSNDTGRESVLIEGCDLQNGERILSRTLVDRQYRITVYSHCQDGELYDLKNDPQEKMNLWNTADKIKSNMLLKLTKAQMHEVRREPIGKW